MIVGKKITIPHREIRDENGKIVALIRTGDPIEEEICAESKSE
jgi:hypothetical protein